MLKAQPLRRVGTKKIAGEQPDRRTAHHAQNEVLLQAAAIGVAERRSIDFRRNMRKVAAAAPIRPYRHGIR